MEWVLVIVAVVVLVGAGIFYWRILRHHPPPEEDCLPQPLLRTTEEYRVPSPSTVPSTTGDHRPWPSLAIPPSDAPPKAPEKQPLAGDVPTTVYAALLEVDRALASPPVSPLILPPHAHAPPILGKAEWMGALDRLIDALEGDRKRTAGHC